MRPARYALALLLLACEPEAADAPQDRIAPDKCPEAGEYQAFDMVGYATQPFLDAMRSLGIDTAIRYYDWEGAETIKGKIPSKAELALLKESGFKLLAVFQHNNRPLSTFADSLGHKRYTRDPAEILKLAARWGQPAGSAVYLGVDHDHYTAEDKAVVRKYFAAIAPKIRAAGYRVGMYGSGANCESLADAGLIDASNDPGRKPLCWIAGSSGWSGTKQTLASGRYVLRQKVNQRCAGRSLDFNKANAEDFGQWALP